MAANEIGSTCINGHLVTAETQYVYPKGARLAGKMVCKVCRANAQKRIKGKAPNDFVQVWNRHKTTCPKGHPYDSVNTHIQKDGSRRCKTCAYVLSTKSSLKNKYGLTLKGKEELLTDQGGMCPICKTVLAVKGSHVDHNHTTGEVRGLLCGKCNTGLGQFSDSPELLLAAAKYLAETN